MKRLKRNRQAWRRSGRVTLATTALGLVALAAMPSPSSAHADPHFGPHDVATVFYVSKSENRNRVDYGLHLDADCHAQGQAPVFPYWRMLEDHPPRLEGLSFGEPRAYGVASQHVDAPSAEGTWIHLDLRALENRPIDVLALRNSSGHCVAAARMIIDGQVSYLHYVYVDVGGGLIPSVDYIDLHGRSVSLERSVSERIQR